MKTQTSIYLPDELFAELARRAPQQDERSNIISEALRHFFSTYQNTDNDLSRINAYAEELNQEAEDVLDYQVKPWSGVTCSALQIPQPVTQNVRGFLL